MHLTGHLIDHTYQVLFRFGAFTVEISKHSVVMWIAAVLCLLIVGYCGWRYRSRVSNVPKGYLMNAVEVFVIYVRDKMVYPIMGKELGDKYLNLVLSLFTFILTCNFLGLVPAIKLPFAVPVPFFGEISKLYPSGAATGDPWVNLALASSVLFIGAIHSIREHGLLGYIANFVPHGVPWPVAIIMFPIEVFGTLIKHVILAVRLMANMVAGHAVLFGILGVAVIFSDMLASPAAALSASVIPVALGLLIYGLEVIVAIIQAYVFTLLSVIFLETQVEGH
jgi:F-type H+-transporting ATPase subunit a